MTAVCINGLTFVPALVLFGAFVFALSRWRAERQERRVYEQLCQEERERASRLRAVVPYAPCEDFASGVAESS